MPHDLFAYRDSAQHSTKESPFFLLYGRDPVLPTREMLKPLQKRTNIDADDYTREITLRMSTVWKTTKAKIKEVQKKQKCQHKNKAKDPQMFEGNRVFLYSSARNMVRHTNLLSPLRDPIMW